MNVIDSIDSIGTFGAYHFNYFKDGDYFIFKYINLHIWPDGKLNKSKVVKYVNFATLKLKGSLVSENGVKKEDSKNETNILHLGGLDLTTKEDSEFIFRVIELSFIESKKTKWRDNPYVPYFNSPNCDISEKEIIEFNNE